MIRSLPMGSGKRIEVRSQEPAPAGRQQWLGVYFFYFVFSLLLSTSAFAAAITGRVEVVDQYSIKPRKLLEDRIKAERSLVVNKDGGVKNAVVLVRGVKDNTSLPKAAFVINQKNKTFLPHILAVPVGSTITFKNEDPFVHRIISDSEAKRLRMEFAYEGAAMDVSFDKPGTVELWCDDHKRMQAWIMVLDTPFFAVTDEKGHFIIQNLPSGRYALEVWHEVLGTQTQEIEVKEGEDIKVDFKLPGKEF